MTTLTRLRSQLATAWEALEFYANKDNLDDFDAPGHCLAKMTTAQRHALGAPMAETDPRRYALFSEDRSQFAVHWVCDLGDIAREALAKLEAPPMGSEPNDNGVIENVEGCLPCPFCGGTKIYIQVFYEHVDHAIGCDTCHAGWSMGNFNSNTEAIAAWNRRDRRWQGDDVVDTWQRCPICYGTGRKDGFTLGDPCPTCLGKRIISVVDGKPPKDMKETP